MAEEEQTVSVGYVSLGEVKDFLSYDTNSDIGVSDGTLNTLIQAGKEMIDGYCNKTFETGAVPKLVGVCNMELVRAMLADSSKASESIDDYSYSANKAAFAQILARLNYLKIGEETLNAGKVNARLI